MRLIDADALEDSLGIEDEDIHFKYILREVPTIDPYEHGHWIDKINNKWQAYSHDACSVCGWWNTRNAKCYNGRKGKSLNYCPNCGAKMDENIKGE